MSQTIAKLLRNLRFLATPLVVVVTALIPHGPSHATVAREASDGRSVPQRIAAVREHFKREMAMPLAPTDGPPTDHQASPPGDGLAQWYNWGNWPNWPDAWRNYWRNW